MGMGTGTAKSTHGLPMHITMGVPLTDASNWHTGGILSFGPTWETTCPVAFDSTQLNSAEKNYPIHEKELLSIICTLKKWHADLLGSPIYVSTDH
jgi:hypothetical protein